MVTSLKQRRLKFTIEKKTKNVFFFPIFRMMCKGMQYKTTLIKIYILYSLILSLPCLIICELLLTLITDVHHPKPTVDKNK